MAGRWRQMQEQAPLLVSLRAPGAAPQRLAALGRGAAVQDAALKSSGGWVRVALTPRGRALRPVLLPWLLVTLLTTGWTCAAHFVDELRTKTPVDGLLQVYLPLATTMGFLLVFRLNRYERQGVGGTTNHTNLTSASIAASNTLTRALGPGQIGAISVGDNANTF